jgi:hypothetical protein
MVFKGDIDCSANPNYPAGTKGEGYRVSQPGLIGGGSGIQVDIGDFVLCINNSTGGTQAETGSDWMILEHNLTRFVAVTLDGGASTPTTGAKGYFAIPFDCTIVGWSITADASGSAVFDVWKVAWGTIPSVANTITASAKPTLSSATMAKSTTLTGWTVAVSKDDLIGFNLDSVTTCKVLTLELILKVKQS